MRTCLIACLIRAIEKGYIQRLPSLQISSTELTSCNEGDAKQKEAEARQREDGNGLENVARRWWERWSIGKSPSRQMSIMEDRQVWEQLDGKIALITGGSKGMDLD
jgi:hypothetical protein